MFINFRSFLFVIFFSTFSFVSNGEDKEYDCSIESNYNLSPIYCANKILEKYQITESEDGSIYISNELKNDSFIEFCRKSTLDSLDKDVALLCLKKMN